MVYCDKEYVAQIIKNARKKKKLKQSELAEKIGISEKHLSKIETGKNYPALDNFLKIAEILDISLKDFGLKVKDEVSPQRKDLHKVVNTFTEQQVSIYSDVIDTLRKYI